LICGILQKYLFKTIFINKLKLVGISFAKSVSAFSENQAFAEKPRKIFHSDFQKNASI